MKKLILSTLFLMAILVIGNAQTKNFIDQPYIEVNGYADSLVTPNEIYIGVVITEKDTRDRIPLEETETKMVNGLKNLGINTEKDLTTNDMGSNYRFYLLKKKDIMKTKEYSLKVNNAVTATKVLMMLEDQGISNTFIERVNHSDMQKIKNSVRIKAIETAKLKAVALTNALGQTVGPAIYITDNESQINSNEVAGSNSRVYLAYDPYDKNKSDLPKIDFDKIKVSTIVSVKFILK